MEKIKDKRIDKCGTCGADIIWVKTINDKPIPLNPEMKTILVKALGSIHPKYQTVRGRESHFATCPQANKWRKKK